MAPKAIPSYMLPKGSSRQPAAPKAAQPKSAPTSKSTAQPTRTPGRAAAVAIRPQEAAASPAVVIENASPRPAPREEPTTSGTPQAAAADVSKFVDDDASPVIVSVPRTETASPSLPPAGNTPRTPINPSVVTTPRDGICGSPRDEDDGSAVARSTFSTSPTMTPLQELLVMREGKRLALQLIEQDIKRHANELLIEEKHSRAADFLKRAATLTDKLAEMKIVVQKNRNMDRVLVKIRDELDNLDRVLRMKRAEMRQKEATVDIISKRYAEQRAGSDLLLAQISETLEKMEETAFEMDKKDSAVAFVRPSMSLQDLSKMALWQEMLLHDMTAGLQELREEDALASSELHRTQAEAAELLSHATDDHPTNVDDVLAEWEVEKDRLIVEYSALAKVQKDLHFHIKRGTHIKSTSQLNEFAAQSVLQDVRELRLTLGEIMTANDFTKDEIRELHQRLQVVHGSHQRRLDALQSESSLAFSARMQAEDEALQLSELRRSLELQLAEAHLISGQPLLHLTAARDAGLGETRQGDHEAGTSGEQTPGKSTRRQRSVDTSEVRASIEAAVREKRPKSLLSRLTAPTQARDSCLRAQREEQEFLKQHVEAVKKARPVGCRGKPGQ